MLRHILLLLSICQCASDLQAGAVNSNNPRCSPLWEETAKYAKYSVYLLAG